ncbi:PREDICTED: transcription factor EGL1-like isoform X1 [Lupinus angustifolius]|uniref:transcription factor EGL1-like isoform X1 n=1 Tax=Lupinus angustifolius TaxID=3871 RepID=UPI00092F0098|nr:PREDICTED: transcription factor EGL1-like isoform X1 [Lupinus angustifolius]
MEMVTENMKRQLCLAVRSIQWIYAIFWSGSDTNPRVLSWGEGYYNGDIKTRKTNQGLELNSDQIGLQRSEQLRELFRSLKTTETTKKPSATLPPEDLTDTEWYYLVCMSFVFNIGQGLPGRTLANDRPIWLCNAHSTDCILFSRSLLAKSASIQTVVCFPFMEGVIELGTTDLVQEDLSLIQQIRTSFLNILEVDVSKKAGPTLNTRNDEDVECAAFGQNAYNVKSTAEVGNEVINTTSPNISDALQANQPAEEALMVETWQVMDDELSNCVHNSMHSSDCISQTFVSPEKIASVANGENTNDHYAEDLQKFNNPKMTLVDPQSDDWRYQSVLSTLLKSSDQLTMGTRFQNFHQESSFVSWKKGEPIDCRRPRAGKSQNLLKKVLFEVPQMHLEGLLESQEDNDYKDGTRPDVDENGTNHVLSERRRRAKLNERFLTLRSMVPSISKDDKVSILDDAIEYLRKIEKRIRELEAQRDIIDIEARTKRSPQDMVERTSDNYFNKIDTNGKKPLGKKRKVCDIDAAHVEINSDAFKGSSANDVTVSVSGNEVVIEMKSLCRQGRVLEIIEAVSSLNLDLNSVQSTEADGNVYLKIKSKFQGPTIASAKKIKQTLQRVAPKS